jgi:agmatinase
MPTTLPNPRLSPRFSGIATFCRYPRLVDVAPENQPLDWALYGVPFDAGATYRPGSRFGPRAIREETQYVKRYHVEHDVDVCETLSLCDAGDAPVTPYDVKANVQSVLSWTRTLAVAPSTKLFAIGGDHSIAYANIRASWERVGKPSEGLALLHFDSHLDTVDSVWDCQWGHASPFRRAIEDKLINPRAMLSVGIKGPLNRKDDLDFARDQGVTILSHERFEREGLGAIATFVAALASMPTYLSFDIDCVDPAFAPGTGTPCPGGMTSAQAFAALRACKGARLCGADVVEVLPDRDVAGITSLLAGHVVFEVLALDAAISTRANVRAG